MATFQLQRILLAFVFLTICVGAISAQTQRRRLSLEASYAIHQDAAAYFGDFDGERYEGTEDASPFTFGLNYRVSRSMSFYGG